ncbi:MAG: glycosyltransferase family 92 protein, partial [Hungatella sp.]|nr:glycosyltransferase family 92 protein [Hungatella sp.]
MDRIKYVRENKYFIFDRPYDLTIENVTKKFAKFILASKYAFDLLLNRKNTITDKKYKVSICAIFKDESSVLREWIEYHLIVGVEHFYLYNNDSIDNYKEILDPYINKGIVTLIEWPGKQRQISAYEDSIEQYSGETTGEKALFSPNTFS